MRPNTAWLDCVIRFLPTNPGGVREPVGVTRIRGVQQQSWRLDRIPRDHNVAGTLEMPRLLTMIVYARCAPVRARLDPPDHGQVTHLGPGTQGARNPHGQGRTLGVGGTAEPAEAAIHAGRRLTLVRASGRRQRRQGRLAPADPDRLAPPRQQLARAVQFVRPVRIAPTFWPPWIRHWPGNVDLPFGLAIPVPHLLPTDGPVSAIAQCGARREPFRPESQRDHRIVHGRTTDRLAAVLAAQADGVRALRHPLVGPVELVLLGFVGSKILQRSEERPGIEGHHRKPLLSQPPRQRPPAVYPIRRHRM